ncbi:MAG: hypothetical protein H0W92_04755, partial [Sphingomonas sp.]|nr:hypothetical protein [Sphingomonas sp.]
LADELFHRAVHGTVDQVWKDGEVVAERHRHDNRLSIAVLNRLDARCDRADRIGAATQRVVAGWVSYLAALAEDRTADALALLEPPAPPLASTTPVHPILGQGSDPMLIHQLHQLRAGKAIDETGDFADADDDDDDDEERVWVQNYTWRTNFPPPDDFNGDESGFYPEDGYDRSCTPEEAILLDARYPSAFNDVRDDQREDDEAERDAFFAELAQEVEDEDKEGCDIAPPGDEPEPLSSSVEGPAEAMPPPLTEIPVPDSS